MRGEIRLTPSTRDLARSNVPTDAPFSAAEVFVYGIFLISAVGPLARYIPLGPFTLSGFFSLVTPIAACLLILIKPSLKRKSVAFTIPILALALIAALWDFINMLSNDYVFENASVVVLGFAILIVFPSILQYTRIVQIYHLSIKRVSPIYLLILTIVTLTFDEQPAVTQLGVLFFSFHAINFLNSANRQSAAIALIIFCETLLLNSRIIVIAEFVIFSIALLPHVTRRPLWALCLFAIMSGALITLFNSPWFLSRITGGDNALLILGNHIDTSGRLYNWGLIWESIQNNIWFGNGHSVPTSMRNDPQWNHPHNDYLRILHQTGVFGLTLWLLFAKDVLKLGNAALHNLDTCARSTAVSAERLLIQTSLYSFLGVSIMMITDNSIVYSYVTYPMGLLLGLLPVMGRFARSV